MFPFVATIQIIIKPNKKSSNSFKRKILILLTTQEKKESKPNRFGRLSWYPQTQDKSPIFFPWLCSVEALVGVAVLWLCVIGLFVHLRCSGGGFNWLSSVWALVGVGCVATAKVEEDWESQLVFSRKFKEGVQVSKGVKVHWIPYMALHIYGSSVTKWLSCCWVLSIYFGSNKSSNKIRIWYLVKNLSLIYLLRIWKKKKSCIFKILKLSWNLSVWFALIFF